MATSTEPAYQAPYCEDYDSEQSEVVKFTGRGSPNAANVTKRRSDLDKEKLPAQERVHPNVDLRSDSGYSSYTTTTVSSADSGPSATTQPSPPVAPAVAAPAASQSPAPKPRRPTVTQEQRKDSSSPRPSKPSLSRTASQTSKPSRRPTINQRDRRESKAGECTDPNCKDCPPASATATARHRRPRPELPPSASARDVSKPSVVDSRSTASDPPYSPPSPTYYRQNSYMQGGAVIQPAQQRRRGSSTVKRPVSYAGEHGAQYWQPGMPGNPYPSPPQERERGPPPSASAYYQGMPPPAAPYSMQRGQTPGYYPPQQYNQTTPPYDGQQRPVLSQRNSSAYGTHGTRTGPAPIITQQQPPRDAVYSARYGQQPQSASATQSRFPQALQLQDQAYESSGTDSASEEEQTFEHDFDPRDPRNARALMPAAKLKRSKSKKRRPSVLRAKTTQVADVVPERSGRERATSRAENPPSRRMSVSRPAPPQRETQSAYDTPRARVMVNQTKANRRQSTQVYDKVYEQYVRAKAQEDAQALAREEAQAQLRKEAKARAREEAKAEAEAVAKARAREEAKARAKEEAKVRAREEAAREAAMEARYQAERERKRQNRNSRVIHAPEPFEDTSSEEESSEEEVEQAPVVLRQRRPTESAKGKAPVVETKMRRRESAVEDYISAQRGSRDSYADQTYKAAKRHSRMPSEPSHSGSSRSGSDKQSQSNRTAVTSNGSNEIRLRVDASAPLSLTFNGEMEGRTLQLVPTSDGMADIVISGSRGEGSVYHASERGSVRSHRKSIIGSQPRRDAEEMTERSVHSSRSRRDGRVVRESQEIRDSWDSRAPVRRRTEYHG